MLFAKGVNNIVFAFADLVAYVLSFANKIRSKNRDERDILIDIAALIQNILSVVSMGAGGVAMVAGDELLEVEAVAIGAAVGTQAGVVILGLTRVFLTIDRDVRYDIV